MRELLRAPRAALTFSLTSVIGVLLFAFAIAVLMLPPSQIIGERPPEMTCLQVAFTPARMSEVVLGFEPPIRQAIADLLVPGDMALAWGYGLVLFGLTALLAMRLPGKWFRVGAIVMWAPLLASTLDCIEDVFLYSAVQRLVVDAGAEIPLMIPVLAGVAATLKYICLSVITPAYGFSATVKGLQQDRSIPALILYVLVVYVMASMVLQPAREIPPCFF